MSACAYGYNGSRFLESLEKQSIHAGDDDKRIFLFV